jgi:hypothetical protein
MDDQPRQPTRLSTREPTVLPDELLSKIATRKHNPTSLPHDAAHFVIDPRVSVDHPSWSHWHNTPWPQVPGPSPSALPPGLVAARHTGILALKHVRAMPCDRDRTCSRASCSGGTS